MARRKQAKKQSETTPTVQCCDCCGVGGDCCNLPSPGCCQVEAVVGVDGRGQMVLPKDLRDKVGIRPDDKLAVVAWTKEEEVCCLTLLKVDRLAEAVRTAYGPMLGEIIRR